MRVALPLWAQIDNGNITGRADSRGAGGAGAAGYGGTPLLNVAVAVKW